MEVTEITLRDLLVIIIVAFLIQMVINICWMTIARPVPGIDTPTRGKLDAGWKEEPEENQGS
jgi:hypothetical protein